MKEGVYLKNILTIDVEEWFHANDFHVDERDYNQAEFRVEKNTDYLLSILDEFGVKATFFTLGSIARSNPKVVQNIFKNGHEIASHGCNHKMVNEMTPEEFREDLRCSCGYIEDITGEKVTSFRAPSWSIDVSNLWALEILDAEGITVDSSMQPFRTFLSGSRKLPRDPFHPVLNGKRLNLLEIPSTTINLLGMRIPFSGGTYLRVLPEAFIVWAFKRVNKQRQAMAYLHPWELDTNPPKIKSNFMFNISHNTNLHTTERKLRRLLSEFQFTSLNELLFSNYYPDKPLSYRRR